MSIRKLAGGLILTVLIMLLFLMTVQISGFKGALMAWGTSVLFVGGVIVGFFLLEL